MSTGKKSRVPIPLPHNVQGDQPPTVPFHSGSAEVPPPPLTSQKSWTVKFDHINNTKLQKRKYHTKVME